MASSDICGDAVFAIEKNAEKVQIICVGKIYILCCSKLISIKAPEGQLCDTFDSDMMASLPFLDMQTVLDFYVDPLHIEDKHKVDPTDPRKDLGAFKKLTDEQCRQLIKDANEGLIKLEE